MYFSNTISAPSFALPRGMMTKYGFTVSLAMDVLHMYMYTVKSNKHENSLNLNLGVENFNLKHLTLRYKHTGVADFSNPGTR